MNTTILIVGPIISLSLAHGVKVVLDRRRRVKAVGSYGGMPSTHAAFVTTLAVLVALQEGLTSPAFGISLALAIVVLTDALVFRRRLEEFGGAIRRLAERLPEAERSSFPDVNVRFGHSIAEVAAGVIFGAIVAFGLKLVS